MKTENIEKLLCIAIALYNDALIFDKQQMKNRKADQIIKDIFPVFLVSYKRLESEQ